MGFFRKSPSILGVDIGTTSIKIVELEKNGKKAKLKNYGEYKTSSSKEGLMPVSTSFLSFSEDKISSIIKEILEETKIEAREANFSLPVFSSFSTVIELPLMEPEEIPGAIRFQSHQYVPVPVEEVVLDWSIIKEEDLALSENKMKVLLVAIPKDVIEKYGKIGEAVGLSIKTLELESFAQARAVIGEDKNPVLILDIGGRTTSITIVDQGFIRLCHSLDFSTFSLIEDLSQRLNISFERAEIFCKEKGLKKEIDEIAIVAPVLTSIVDKMIFGIEKAINSYLSNNPQREIEKIILLGGGALIPGISNYISNKLQKETIIGNPFLNIDYPPVLKSVLEEIGPGFATAVGLALRDFEEKK
ncbi:MAG TPA: type IV pilus assembly protein PilM [Candidatus Pacearchaeota archaeon]|nr:type IV pilus assembly protein PilM [Candidatus Pacearchaeota archaeon]HPZ74288.1 type IV pilus assembly protein PilM [Candidatus Pacearchaeota archaeon]HQD88967.1 type IV pilus assembly protein PilM [Candidatus Pacearchaeota archaeon]